MNLDLKFSIDWNKCRHAPLWLFNLHCGIDATGSPGIVCIVYYQAYCHPLEYGTSSMGKHLMAKAHMAQLNGLTESEVSQLTNSMVNGTALAILKRQGS